MLDELVRRARQKKWAAVAVANLRTFVGFAFVPAGLKKLLGEPFTDPHLHGPFHDFLHAFHATGWFYRFVGATQLVAALLLMTGRYARIGALLAAPIFTTILAFCWSTKVYPTAVVVSLLWLATGALVVWDLPSLRWRLARRAPTVAEVTAAEQSAVDPAARLWEIAGAIVLGLYLAVCLATGGVYRPRGVARESAAFYVFPAMLLVVVAANVAGWRRMSSRAQRGDHADR